MYNVFSLFSNNLVFPFEQGKVSVPVATLSDPVQFPIDRCQFFIHHYYGDNSHVANVTLIFIVFSLYAIILSTLLFYVVFCHIFASQYTDTMKVNITATVDPKLRDKVKKQAEKERRSFSSMLEVIMDAFFKKGRT